MLTIVNPHTTEDLFNKMARFLTLNELESTEFTQGRQEDEVIVYYSR